MLLYKNFVYDIVDIFLDTFPMLFLILQIQCQ